MKSARETLPLRAWIAIVAMAHFGMTVVAFLLEYEFRDAWSHWLVPLHVRAIHSLLSLLILPLGELATRDADLLSVLGIFVFPLNSLLVGIFAALLVRVWRKRNQVAFTSPRSNVGHRSAP